MFCYIVSAEHPEFVIQVAGENKEEQAKEGQHLVLAKYTGAENQQFAIFDRAIAAVVTGHEAEKADKENPALVIEPEETGKQSDLVLKSSKNHPTEWFFCEDQTIRTRKGGLAIDIEGANFSEGAKIIAWEHHGKENQKWIPVTVYDAPKEEAEQPKEEAEAQQE